MIYRFADFEIDVAQRELRHRGRVVHTQPRTFDIETFRQAMPYVTARDLATVTDRLASCGIPPHRERVLS